MNNPRAKGAQRQPSDLEELPSEGNPDDGAAPDETKDQVEKRHPQAAEDQPDNIGQGGERSASGDDLLPEGPERHAGKLEALAPQRNADHRDAAEQAADESAENEPQDIPDCSHVICTSRSRETCCYPLLIMQ